MVREEAKLLRIGSRIRAQKSFGPCDGRSTQDGGQSSEDTCSPAGEEGAEMTLGGATGRKWEDGSLGREAWGESGQTSHPLAHSQSSGHKGPSNAMS